MWGYFFAFVFSGLVATKMATKPMMKKVSSYVAPGILTLRGRNSVLDLPPFPSGYTVIRQRRDASSIGEQISIDFLEHLFKRKFTKIRPQWLKNPATGSPMELDCYNADLGLAVEYNGEQHYKYPNFTGATLKQFLAQKRRDKIKQELCKKRGVKLVVVPYFVKPNDIPQYIYDKLTRLN